MVLNLPRRAMLLAVLLAAGALAASCALAVVPFFEGIFGTPPGNPDPGNQSLHALVANPVFADQPPGSVRVTWQENPARRQRGFFTGAWSGPAVTLTFISSESVIGVYDFYAERAYEAGWTPTPGKVLSNGLIWSWSTQIAERRADVSLFPAFDIHAVNPAESGTPRTYSLSGSTW